jgi:hypothetical protein
MTRIRTTRTTRPAAPARPPGGPYPVEYVVLFLGVVAAVLAVVR